MIRCRPTIKRAESQVDIGGLSNLLEVISDAKEFSVPVNIPHQVFLYIAQEKLARSDLTIFLQKKDKRYYFCLEETKNFKIHKLWFYYMSDLPSWLKRVI